VVRFRNVGLRLAVFLGSVRIGYVLVRFGYALLILVSLRSVRFGRLSLRSVNVGFG
jgi:hypothetical protein